MIQVRFLSDELKHRFGVKVYKLSLPGGVTCPNRDGTVGRGGCLFCSEKGAGEFSAEGTDMPALFENAKSRIAKKLGAASHPLFIAYFQSFSATYLPLSILRRQWEYAANQADVAALSIATRPDCLPEEVFSLLAEIASKKPVWVELGLQTIHPKTAVLIRRGYPLSVYDRAVKRLHEIGCEVITHMILGLPGESVCENTETAAYIGHNGSEGIKFHLLYVSEGTDLAQMYKNGIYEPLSYEDYRERLFACLRVLPSSVVVHRLTGDGDKRTLLAPLWTADKKRVLNDLHRDLLLFNVVQGSLLLP